MDNRLTNEEIHLLVGDDDLIKKYKLLNMYSVTEEGPAPVCSTCFITLTPENHHIKNTKCKVCNRELNKQYVLNNKEKVKQYSIKYRKERQDLMRQYEANGFY